MATEEDIKTEKGFAPPHPSEDESGAGRRAHRAEGRRGRGRPMTRDGDVGRGLRGGDAPPRSSARSASSTPAYFAAAIGIAFLSSKFIELAWTRLQMWKPQSSASRTTRSSCRSPALIGGRDRLVLLDGSSGRASSRKRSRASCRRSPGPAGRGHELDRRRDRDDVVSTIFFALMDRFWGFLTNLVYGT